VLCCIILYVAREKSCVGVAVRPRQLELAIGPTWIAANDEANETGQAQPSSPAGPTCPAPPVMCHFQERVLVIVPVFFRKS